MAHELMIGRFVPDFPVADAVKRFCNVVIDAPRVSCPTSFPNPEAHFPIVCVEDCTIQVCPLCAPEEQKTQVANFIMQRTLEDVEPDLESLDEMLITIPSCGHTFTVESRDGHSTP